MSSSDHKALVRQEFTQQAHTYAANPSISDHDRLIRLVQSVQAVHPAPNARVLDVATGPGYVALTFAEAGCEVIGIDLTEAPLSIAEQLRHARGLTNVSFQLADAEHLPFGEQEFDIVVSRGPTCALRTPCARKAVRRACAASSERNTPSDSAQR